MAVRTERKKEINSEKREKAEGRGARRVEGGQNQIEGTNNRGGGGAESKKLGSATEPVSRSKEMEKREKDQLCRQAC